MGHDYHGFALIRSYLGWEVRPKAIWGWHQQHPVMSHRMSTDGQWHDHPLEDWWRAIIEFENGSVGYHDFSGLSYGSALRWERGSRFYGALGMGRNEELTRLNRQADRPDPIRIERRIHNVGGMEVLDALVAHLDQDTIDWPNPFHQWYLDDEAIAVATGLRGLAAALTDGVSVEYGLLQAKRDQWLTMAMRKSAQDGGGHRIPLEAGAWDPWTPS
jgi:hypothetical protein